MERQTSFTIAANPAKRVSKAQQLRDREALKQRGGATGGLFDQGISAAGNMTAGDAFISMGGSNGGSDAAQSMKARPSTSIRHASKSHVFGSG